MPRSNALVKLLPTIHSYHERPQFRHYNYNVLGKLVIAFRPDVMCGEVRPEDWKRTHGGRVEGYCGPPEYRKCLIPLCLKSGIGFEPVDSYDDADVGIDSAGKVDAAEKGLAHIMLSLAKRKDSGVLALTDPAIEHVIRAKHALARGSRAEIEARTWDRRNKRICRNIVSVASRNPKKRILVTIGLEHIPFMFGILSGNPHLSLVPLLV